MFSSYVYHQSLVNLKVFGLHTLYELYKGSKRSNYSYIKVFKGSVSLSFENAYSLFDQLALEDQSIIMGRWLCSFCIIEACWDGGVWVIGVCRG
jgi:hypothetical protein